MNPSTLRRSLAIFLPVAVLLSVLSTLIYGAGQQAYRAAANDPQMQIAQHDRLLLDAGTTPARVAAGPPVDLASSLDTHVSIYDSAGKVVASTARLDGTVPVTPLGVISAVGGKDGAQNWLTWQPQPGVREAAVVTGWRGGALLVGRSLAPTEVRQGNLEQLIEVVWIVGLLLMAVSSYLAARLWPQD